MAAPVATLAAILTGCSWSYTSASVAPASLATPAALAATHAALAVAARDATDSAPSSAASEIFDVHVPVHQEEVCSRPLLPVHQQERVAHHHVEPHVDVPVRTTREIQVVIMK